MVLKMALDMFLEKGTPLFIIKDKSGQTIYWSEGQPLTRLATVVLIDDNSSSASEVAASALQENNRATIVGKKSSGAVGAGRNFELSHEAAMLVTTAQVFTSQGKKLEKEGVTPDVIVELKKEDVAQGKDGQLEKAIEVLKERIFKEY